MKLQLHLVAARYDNDDGDDERELQQQHVSDRGGGGEEEEIVMVSWVSLFDVVEKNGEEDECGGVGL